MASEKDLKYFHVLIHFFQEGKYSVEKLKNVIPSSCSQFFQSSSNLSTWNSSSVVDVPWKGVSYPAFFLQFGENKAEMEDLADDLHDGKLSQSDVPLLQISMPTIDITGGGKRFKPIDKDCLVEKNDGSASLKSVASKEKHERKTTMQCNIIHEARKKINTKNKRDRHPCVPCKTSQQQLVEIKQRLNDANEEVRRLNIKVAHYKEKATKYRNRCKEIKLEAVQETDVRRKSLDTMYRLGESTMVLKDKLSMCRTGDFSKYVGDLLDVLFTTEKLGNSVVKGIKGVQKDVLDANIVNDLQVHVSEKFNVSIQNVRAAIRQKLNVAHKIVMQMKLEKAANT